MWNELIEFLAHIGSIEDLLTLPFHVATQGPMRKVMFDRRGGPSGWDVEKMLARYGVQVYARGFTADTLSVHVKARQANWAEYLINRFGVHTFSQANPANAQAFGRGLPKAWGEPVQPRDWICALLDILEGI